MKLLTFHGPSHRLEVPGFFTIARGESHEIDDIIAEAVVRANPDIEVTIDDLPAATGGSTRRARGGDAQPEAQPGEGQSSHHEQEE